MYLPLILSIYKWLGVSVVHSVNICLPVGYRYSWYSCFLHWVPMTWLVQMVLQANTHSKEAGLWFGRLELQKVSKHVLQLAAVNIIIIQHPWQILCMHCQWIPSSCLRMRLSTIFTSYPTMARSGSGLVSGLLHTGTTLGQKQSTWQTNLARMPSSTVTMSGLIKSFNMGSAAHKRERKCTGSLNVMTSCAIGITQSIPTSFSLGFSQ